MFRETVKFVSISRKSIGNGDSAARLALGISLGMMVGIVPKDSLLTYLFFLVLMVSTANLLCAILSGCLFSWIGFAFDSFTHKLGGLILTNENLESTWTWLYDVPLIPWTRFNNTVVMGSLIAGLVLFVPLYLFSRWFFQTHGPWIHSKIRHNWIFRWLVAPIHPESGGEPG